MERVARKVVDEKKSLRDVAVKQRAVDEINEPKSGKRSRSHVKMQTSDNARMSADQSLKLEFDIISFVEFKRSQFLELHKSNDIQQKEKQVT
ncbi:Hypothetical predicted protein [Octopus vulgaris]|uniref:Uncharacterized protein n=1 Tax=Octopus vulgaris TaxID=6645 RepID=A0AA36F0D3_OCTVU|nr:Hypothetical predicted protein [Octopus vulgaris]